MIFLPAPEVTRAERERMIRKKYWIYTGEDGDRLAAIFSHAEKPENGMRKAILPAMEGKAVKGYKTANTGKIERVFGTVEKAPKKTSKRKQDYFISVFDKKIGQTVKKISGNVLLIDGIAFGLSKPHPKSYYTITDLITGFAVGECRTQKDIFTALTPELMQRIKEKHTAKDTQVYIDRIKDAYMCSDY